jgi:alkylhydroperoxidase family enzyme
MARIDYPDMSQLTPEVQALVKRLPPLNVFRMLAHVPPAVEPFIRFGNALLVKGKLDPILREMAIVRVGILSGASYEVHQHEIISRDLGMAEAKIQALKIGPNSPEFTDQERAILAYTDNQVANTRASDEVFNAVRGFLSVEQVAELTLAIGFYMMVSRFLETFGVDIEENLGRSLDLKSTN